ncbi:unnamed protein product, partial [Durusdinium trenchii]
ELSFQDAHVMAEWGSRASCVFKKAEHLCSVEEGAEDEEGQRRLSVDSLRSEENPRAPDGASHNDLAMFQNILPAMPADTMLMEPPTVLTPLKPRRKSMEETIGDIAYQEILNKMGHRASVAISRT